MGAAASITSPSTTTPSSPLFTPTFLKLAKSELSKDLSATDITNKETALLEVKRIRQALNDPISVINHGKIQINYQMYDTKFDILNGQLVPCEFQTGMEKLDDEYAFSFAMPGCVLDLITIPLSEFHILSNGGTAVPFVEKNEDGTEFINLNVLNTYWVVVHENEEQAKIAAEKYAKSLAYDGIAKNEGERAVGCSCIEGNPCTEGNKYNCKNWEMRFAVAKENGWSG
jgi:hypothetical protein